MGIWANRQRQRKHFIVTDPDLDISSVPLDMVDYLIEALESFKCITKAGFSLKIDDLPEDDSTIKRHNATGKHL